MSYSYSSTRNYRSSGRSYSTKSSPRRNNRGGTGQYIDPKKFIASATENRAEDYKAKNTFTDFTLPSLLKSNLDNVGYQIPTPIQDQAIPIGLSGKDVVGMAGTGTGKTAAFIVPLLNSILAKEKHCAIIIAPTRELAQQIEAELKTLARGSGLHGVLLIGGTPMRFQLQELRQNPQIVIGTPGRIKDHLNRGTLKLHNFDIVVLDEVDRMLDMGFIPDIKEILSQTSSNKQSYFFSATVDERIRNLIQNFANDPVTINIMTSSPSENVHQDVVNYQGNADRLDRLNKLLLQKEVTKVLVFNETQLGVERLNKELLARGFASEAIHGGKSQGQRERALSKFKKNDVSILVATDVAARGIHVADISHVINYSIPKVYDDYIHRIGRAGRAGQVGYAYTFVEKRNQY